MELIEQGGGWCIVGPESVRARIAYATLDGDRLVYTVETNSAGTVGTDEPGGQILRQ
jgi:hypothetical protein